MATEKSILRYSFCQREQIATRRRSVFHIHWFYPITFKLFPHKLLRIGFNATRGAMASRLLIRSAYTVYQLPLRRGRAVVGCFFCLQAPDGSLVFAPALGG